MRHVRLRQVGQQAERELPERVAVAEVVFLQPRTERVRVVRGGEQRRDDAQRPPLRRDAPAQRQPRHEARLRHAQQYRIEQALDYLRHRDQQQHRARHAFRGKAQQQRQSQRPHNDGCDVPRTAAALFRCAEHLAQQKPAHVPPRALAALRAREHVLGDLDLRPARPPRQPRHGLPVVGARGRVHRGVDAHRVAREDAPHAVAPLGQHAPRRRAERAQRREERWRGRAVTGANNRALKSLSDMLKGKQGRFRQNLLGKRVDYSGRSVIVVGPDLKLYQCGVPKEMAIELFRPFVMKKLVEDGVANNIKSAKKMVDKQRTEVWDALEVVIKDHPVMLNRAPTLHRLGIQAFEPVLVEGRALKLHPLCCTAFNADFDGDQMAIHVPLSAEAQAEARILMLSANNLLRPQDGHPVTVPTQDMILGAYYLTYVRLGKAEKGAEQVFVTDAGDTDLPVNEIVDADDFVAAHKKAEAEGSKLPSYKPLKVYRDPNEAIMAYNYGDVGLHAPILVRVAREVNGETLHRTIETTVGRIIYNEPIPQDLGFVDRNDPENDFKLEVDFLVNKKKLGEIIDRCIKIHGTSIAAEMLDKIKAQGYKYSTRSGITVAVCDATIPPRKGELIADAEKDVAEIMDNYENGLLSDEERTNMVIETWEDCTKRVAAELKANFDPYNPINMMLDSGARGNDSQLRQLAGMRGLIANTAGKTIEIPIRANYREGLNILEYFISSRGARKGLADTALRTADSGYLTRRLVDVSQDVIIREEDCGCTEGSDVYDIFDGKRRIVSLTERLTGRYLLNDFVDEETGELIMSKDKMMSEDDAKRVADKVYEYHDKKVAAGEEPEGSLAKIKIRSLLSCQSEHGVCIKCYGANLATGEPVTVGEAVGIIAAQSIGEPGTQLTMRTFHTGGAKDQSDITEGLPRVEELFEARKPKSLALISEISGTVSEREIKKVRNIIVTDPETLEEKAYPIHYGMRVKVEPGDHINKGDTITEGALNPHDILSVLGVEAVHDYLIREVQRTYRMQGVDVNDKHIEVIVRQMMKKVKITDPGATSFLPGAVVDKLEFKAENARVAAKAEATGEELAEAQCMPVLMGITKASLATESFLSAASFQETTRVLTDAAIKGKSDPLLGLKENVIIGKLLPSGTGMKCYSDVQVLPTTGIFSDLAEKLEEAENREEAE